MNLAQYQKWNAKGFSLVEILLVITIISSIMLALMQYASMQVSQARREKTATQIQQILSAALSYYTANGVWPVGTPSPIGTCGGAGDNLSGTTQTLQAGHYLPAVVTKNPWGAAYSLNCTNNPGVFTVSTLADNNSDGLTIAGMLPIASNAGGLVTASVQIPVQNLNNARSLNFASIYNTGQCVPVPICPSGMTAEIMVTPSAVAGTNNGDTTANDLDSFQAYTSGAPSSAPAACVGQTVGDTCVNTPGYVAGNTFWRVCLSVLTSAGLVTSSSTTSNEYMGNILAVTRCAPSAEPSGSTLGVWN